MRYDIAYLVTRSTLLPLVVLICPLAVLICPLAILINLLVVLVSPLVVLVCPLVLLVVGLSVGLFVTEDYFGKSMISCEQVPLQQI